MGQDDLHDDIREIRSLVTQNLAKTVQIETALWPDKGQKSLLTQHDERIDRLENWRSYLVGAWAVITTAAATLFEVHIKKGGGH